MPITEKQTENSIYDSWIRKAIKNNLIIYYNHTEFRNKKEIENSNNNSVGKIFKANWNQTNTILVVKTSYRLDVKKVVNEFKMQKEIDSHINILRVCGISKLDDQYSIVLDYADGGSLYSYLRVNFTKLEWDDKYCLALQLASAMEYIHNKNIIHCNLHAHNVLIHKNSIKVTDFGLSKRVNEPSNYQCPSKILEFLPYLDPKMFNDAFNIKRENHLYITNFKSDIYSIGVLFWLLSSGRKPFCDKDTHYDISLAMDIVNGKREEIIVGTPVEYSDIYTDCWTDDPDERPSIQIVVSCLKSIVDRSIESITNEIEEDSLNKFLFVCNNFTNIMIDDDFNLNTIDYIRNNLLLNLNDLNDNVEKIVDKLIDHLIRMHDELGYAPIETKEIINQNIQYINKPLQIKIFDWLIRNQTSSKYIFFRGKCYENGIGIEKDYSKAFECYKKAVKNENKVVQFNLGRCYGCGIGIEKNYDKSFEWFERSAKQYYFIAQLCLGILYEIVKKDLDSAFYLVDRAAKKGNPFARLYLGVDYEKCDVNVVGIRKDYSRSFVLCKKLTKQGCYSATFILGYLFLNGIGTKKNLEKSIYFIEKEAIKGDKYAQLYLGRFYEDGIVVDKNCVEAFKWFEKAANNGIKHAQLILGYYLERGRVARSGIAKKNIKEAIKWFEKSAEQGYSYAQACLGFLYENGRCYQHGSGVEKNKTKAFEHYKYSVENGYFNGIYTLADCYNIGIGTDINKEKAVNLYNIAAKIKLTEIPKTPTDLCQVRDLWFFR
ncbi:kinase-like domain-containing protein [Rhizophagus clarus]|uniref:Kinase-like domain-containing protein n=1 Tax=Rhizophagus clarus TaxID=94130 RepID=A0A8H3L6I3_9GLOM|nr:kinase-like domain-containing protein [Rhizophagus clarus]